jgi:hypothetical protein
MTAQATRARPTPAPPAIAGADERDLVRRFASGRSVADIAGDNWADRKKVSEVIGRVCGHSRAKAVVELERYDAFMATPAGRRAREAAVDPPAAEQPAESLKPLPDLPIDLSTVAVPENMPADVPPAEPAPSPFLPAAAVHSSPDAEPSTSNEDCALPPTAFVLDPYIKTLLEEASASAHVRAGEIAERIRVMVARQSAHLLELAAELAGALAVGRRELELRERLLDINRIRDELLEELRQLTGKVEDNTTPDGLPLTKEELAAIRDWAKANGRYCPPRARPGRKVIAEYREAMSSAAGES